MMIGFAEQRTRGPDLSRSPTATNSTEKAVIKKVAAPQIIPKQLFVGACVCVIIKDPIIERAIRDALNHIGAIDVDSNHAGADYIIATENVTVQSIQPKNTRGSRLVQKAQGIGKTPKVVLLEQIPWLTPLIMSNRIPVECESETESADEPETVIPAIVVAETKATKRPLYQNMKHMPLIHHERFEKGYTLSPFEALPLDMKSTVEKIQSRYSKSRLIKFQTSPNEGDWCEYCNNYICDPETHRRSYDHIAYTTKNNWEEFDRISDQLTKSFHV